MEKFKPTLKMNLDEKELDIMYQNFIANPKAVREINKLGIPNEDIKKYIVKINDFVEDIKYCENCPGMENCEKANKYIVTKLTYNNKVVERQLVPCKKILNEMSVQKYFVSKDYPSEFEDASLATIDKTSKKKDAARLYADYVKGQSKQWIYITGAPRTGRSYLAAAFINDYARRKKGEVAFINSLSKFKELISLSFNSPQDFEDIMNRYATCDILVIDDLGNEVITDTVRDAILLRLLNERSASKKLTIFTSDYSIQEIVELYATTKQGAIKSKKLKSILETNCKQEINLGPLGAY